MARTTRKEPEYRFEALHINTGGQFNGRTADRDVAADREYDLFGSDKPVVSPCNHTEQWGTDGTGNGRRQNQWAGLEAQL